MESSELKLELSELRLVVEDKTSVHQDVQLNISLDTKTLLFKQFPELDASGIHLCYSFDLIDLRYSGHEIGQHGLFTIDVELLSPANPHVSVPEAQESSSLQDHEATISMCCSLSNEKLPANAKLSFKIAEAESDNAALLVDVLKESPCILKNPPTVDDFNDTLSAHLLEFSVGEIEFLEQRGTSQSTVSAETDQSAQTCGDVWFDYHSVPSVAESMTKSNKSSPPFVDSNGTKGRGRGGGRARGRGRGHRGRNTHGHSLSLQPTPTAKCTYKPFIPRSKSMLNSQEQSEYDAQEAPRLKRAEDIRKFFGGDKVSEPADEKRTNVNETRLAAAVAESKSNWQAFAAEHGRTVAYNNRTGHAQGSIQPRGSFAKRSAKVIGPRSGEEVGDKQKETMRPGDWNDFSYEQIKEMLGEQ